MKKIIFIIAITLILVFSIIINGCSKGAVGSPIKSEEDATNKIAEIGEDIGDVGDEIEDINQDLG